MMHVDQRTVQNQVVDNILVFLYKVHSMYSQSQYRNRLENFYNELDLFKRNNTNDTHTNTYSVNIFFQL